jgi:tetratricopeptide (TPR) repeat protein
MGKNTDPTRAAVVQYRLAFAWQQRGRAERAIQGYRAVLQLEPDYVPAHLALGRLLVLNERLAQAVDVFRQALELAPNEAELHKGLVEALAARGEMDEAAHYYGLVRKDTRPIEIGLDDVLCCAAVRNEAVRLPYFLSYYRQKGVAWFLIVDNNSADDTLPYLLQQPDVYVWHSTCSFKRANFGAGWFEVLLRQYGRDHWCLIVDADELLYYPDCEHKSLSELCGELDLQDKKAFTAVLLDMYSDRPIKDTHYARGQRFLEACPFFDREFYHTKYENAGPFKNQTLYYGGVRQRVFGTAGEFILSKVPLVKYSTDLVLAGGQHFTSRPAEEIAAESGALLHFKYFSTFVDYVSEEVERKEHSGGAWQYGEYARGLARPGALTLYDSRHSIRLQDSRQLVRLGIMRASGEADATRSLTPATEFPRIGPVSDPGRRPFWSVMVTAYDRTRYLERALRSVTEQAPGPDEMQIEVVNDGAERSVQDAIEAIVKAAGDDRVSFYRHPERVGHPHIFNVCIERARGHWVHILHDDDWVEPGFYSAVRAGIEGNAGVGAAFCRHTYVHEASGRRRVSLLEADRPGILENWLERIAVTNQLPCPAVVVRRQVYEDLGGYCPQARSAFDWEMWKRIAVHYPFWYEPQALACFCQSAGSESQRLIESGEQILDALRSIEISQAYLPAAVAETLSQRARERYAQLALLSARQQLKAGRYRAAIANIRAGLQCSRSERVRQVLVSVLLQS